MCGVFGIYSFRDDDIDHSDAMNALAAIGHRGRDHVGHFQDRRFFVGLNRLSIYDLSPQANQPFRSDDYIIAFNGAIFNFAEIREELEKSKVIFSTNSDTEVLLKAYEYYGSGFENKLNGMWAFVIYETSSGNLYISRDRYGIKPLYYTFLKDGIAFSSEIKSFYKLKNWNPVFKLDSEKMFDQDIHEIEQVFENIHQVEPGTYSVLEKNKKLVSHRYYHWNWEESMNNKIRRKEAIDSFLTLLEDSFRLRYRADVPVGLALSGGMDSNAIASLMPNGTDVFSVVFEGYPVSEKSFIEHTIRKRNFNPHWVDCDLNTYVQNIESVTYHQELPFQNFSVIAQHLLFQAAADSGMKVMLSGQGADEILMGYDMNYRYFVFQLLNANKLEGLIELGKIAMKNPSGILKKLLQHRDTTQKPIMNSQINSLKGLAYFMMNTNPLTQLLRFEDRNSMAHGIESRQVFLDHRLVEFCFSLPDEYLISKGLRKPLLRDSMQGKVPIEIIERKDKIAFNTPQKEWLKGNSNLLNTLAHEALRDLNINVTSPNKLKLISLYFWMKNFKK